MRILVVSDSGVDGAEDLSGLCAEFSQREHEVSKCFTSNPAHIANVVEHEFDLVILFNAFNWFIANRRIFLGRPKVAVCSFCFADHFEITGMKIPVGDLGIHFFISNCDMSVKQIGKILPARFLYKPFQTFENFEGPKGLPGAVIRRIADHDLSAYVYANKHLKVNKISTFSGPVKGDFVENFKTVNAGDFDRLWRGISKLIVTPRLTDYRTGVIPTEVFTALHLGIEPVIPYHPIYEPARGVLQAFFTHGLEEFKERLKLPKQPQASCFYAAGGDSYTTTNAKLAVTILDGLGAQ